jgi:hypothetical protein
MNYTQRLNEAEQLSTMCYLCNIDLTECITEVSDYLELGYNDSKDIASGTYKVLSSMKTNEPIN